MIPERDISHLSYLFDEDLLSALSQTASIRNFYKDDIIIDIGSSLHFIPLILSGNIKVMREDHEHNELLLYVLESGDTCSMSLTCCLSSSKSKIRAIADTDTSVAMIPIENMQLWMDTNKSWRNFILQSYQIRFDEMLETIDTLAFMKMDERLSKYLIDKVKLNASTSLNITHQNIARDLNTSRVVVSRLLKQLEHEQKIKLGRHKIEVLMFK